MDDPLRSPVGTGLRQGSSRGLPGVFQGLPGVPARVPPLQWPKMVASARGVCVCVCSDHRPAFRWVKISPRPIYGCGPRKTRLHPLVKVPVVPVGLPVAFCPLGRVGQNLVLGLGAPRSPREPTRHRSAEPRRCRVSRPSLCPIAGPPQRGRVGSSKPAPLG